jgi:hypothetical protein
VRDLGQIFPGDAELIGQIVVAGRDDHFSRAVIVRTAGTVGGCDAEVSVFAIDCLDPFVLVNIEIVMLRYFAVIL